MCTFSSFNISNKEQSIVVEFVGDKMKARFLHINTEVFIQVTEISNLLHNPFL